jgi:hypothetical protein
MGRNIVYILGAGSSKDFGFPLGNEIFAQADQVLSYKNNSGIKSKLKMALKEVEQIMAQIFSNLPMDKMKYPLFEEVLTFILDSKKYTYQDWNNHGKIVSMFEKPTEEVLSNFVEMMGLTFAGSMLFYYGTDFGAYEEFIKSLNFKKDNISFISLNYDIIIDTILYNCVKEKIIEDFTYGIPLSYLKDGSRCREKGVLLLKPHGSLNLSFHFGHRHQNYFYYEDNVVTGIINKSDWTNCPSCKFNFVEYLIVPPLYNKSAYIKEVHKIKTYHSRRDTTTSNIGVVEVYRNIVDKKTCEVLQNADEIMVIGYSMPPYDFDFKSLLIKGSMANKNRKNVPISIITKAQEHQLGDLKSRFEHLAGKVEIVGNDGFYNYIKKAKV